MSAETTFTIQGMSCGGCVNSVTRVLKAVPGIEPLHVEVGKATVSIDPALATAELAKAAIERAGFSVVKES
ncbi:MAG: heavy-metal-associated domain-containing protein [Vicinamibacterales bacterium]